MNARCFRISMIMGINMTTQTRRNNVHCLGRSSANSMSSSCSQVRRGLGRIPRRPCTADGRCKWIEGLLLLEIKVRCNDARHTRKAADIGPKATACKARIEHGAKEELGRDTLAAGVVDANRVISIGPPRRVIAAAFLC